MSGVEHPLNGLGCALATATEQHEAEADEDDGSGLRDNACTEHISRPSCNLNRLDRELYIGWVESEDTQERQISSNRSLVLRNDEVEFAPERWRVSEYELEDSAAADFQRSNALARLCEIGSMPDYR